MPFDTAGVYSPPSGATTAQPGDVIASATWNAIFTDISTVLTKLAQTQIIQVPRSITASGDITVAASDTVILIKASVPNILLPVSSSKTGPVTIIGAAAGIFGTHNSILTPNGADTIDGLATVTLNNEYQSITLWPLSSGGYLVMS